MELRQWYRTSLEDKTECYRIIGVHCYRSPSITASVLEEAGFFFSRKSLLSLKAKVGSSPFRFSQTQANSTLTPRALEWLQADNFITYEQKMHNLFHASAVILMFWVLMVLTHRELQRTSQMIPVRAVFPLLM